MTTSSSGSAIAVRAWLLLRLPLLLLAAYALRGPILDVIERLYDIIFVTEFGLDVLSTPISRLVYGAVLVVLLAAVYVWALRALSRPNAFLLITALGAFVAVCAHVYAGTWGWLVVVPVAVLFCNLLFTVRNAPDVLPRAVVIAVPALAEVFFFRCWIRSIADPWARSRDADATRGNNLAIAFTLLAFASSSAVVVRGGPLVPLEQFFRGSPAVSSVDKGDFNWIELDRSKRYLFVTGHGVPRLRRYDVENWSAAPLEAAVQTAGAEAFAYDPITNTVYVVNGRERTLFHVDGATLQAIRSVPVDGLSPGDPWLVADPRTGAVIVASEADVRTGTPFLVIDRDTGEVRDTRDLEAGNMLLHPSKPLVYISFFRRTNGVLTYDIERQEILATFSTPERLDRMVYWAEGDELLVTSPLESSIIRLDAATLEPKGRISADFGVRVLAIDESRQLLLSGSLSSGRVRVQDIRSARTVASHYVAPWLRTIALHEASGIAYVTSNGGLFELRYASDSP